MIAQQLRNIDYHQLDISDYSRNYILRLLPNLDYYLDIYSRCLVRLSVIMRKPLSEITMVDYGGGHGFLSCLAKYRGAKQVIYIDFNPQAVKTVQAVAEQLGYGPDVMLQGDAATLRRYCAEHNITPDAVLGMDVIEHIYRLEDFFADIHEINPEMAMLFTTGSTPFNKRVVKRLQQVMVLDEMGRNGQPGFFELRRRAIAQQYPEFTQPELDIWAESTRGLTYADTLKAVETHTPNLMDDPYNTCDPATGSWTERILPIATYQDIASSYGWKVTVGNGFYNTYRKGPKSIPSRMLNFFLTSKQFRSLAPFIILEVN